ncbi:hypothetical protein G9P44_003268 [Scheffersomyces stipitis]|nr:hypothetical protein G9P44_003268 [Scheffersomyces stipitis]
MLLVSIPTVLPVRTVKSTVHRRSYSIQHTGSHLPNGRFRFNTFESPSKYEITITRLKGEGESEYNFEDFEMRLVRQRNNKLKLVVGSSQQSETGTYIFDHNEIEHSSISWKSDRHSSEYDLLVVTIPKKNRQVS